MKTCVVRNLAFLLFLCWSASSVSGAAPATQKATVATTASVSLKVEPLNKSYVDVGITVRFKYKVPSDMPDGVAEVRMRNTDSGEDILKRFPITLKAGEHEAWAAWGKDGPDTSATNQEAVAALNNDVVQKGGLPDGLYVPDVTLKDAGGKILAAYQFSADEVRHMIVTGKASRKITKAAVAAQAAELKAWYEELSALEEKARAAGADTSIPHLMVLALRETAKQAPGRLNPKECHVVADNHAYAAAHVPKIRQQLEQLIKDPKSGGSANIVPRPSGRLTIKNGYYHADGKPVFMTGLCMFSFWPDVELMREFGYNLVHISSAGNCVFPDSEEPTGQLLVADYNGKKPTVRQFLDECSRFGIKADLGLNVHPLPKWFLEKYPDAKLDGHSVAGFVPFDIEHPAAIKYTERFLETAMKEVANHPALNTIWLANEPTMLNFGPLSTALYRKHLKKKYGSMKRLNAAWGTALSSFEEIQPSMKLFAKPSPELTDFWWFNLGRLTHYFEFMQKCVRKHDKTVPTCFKLNNLQMGWYCPTPNVDQEGVSDISEVIGMDSGTYPFAKPYYDWLRCLSPEKPVVNLEFKGGGVRTKLDLWKGALHGLSAIDWWCWMPNPMFASAMSDTGALHEGPLAAYNIQRLLPQIMAFQKFPRSPFVVLYPNPVLPRAKGYFNVHTPAVNALKLMGYGVDYVTEKRLAEGRLHELDYRVMVLPSANYITDKTFKLAGDFVRKGGVAVVIGELPERDEYGRTRELGWLQTPAGARPAFGEATNGVSFAYGKGKVWVLPAGEEKQLIGRLEEVARQELPAPPLRIVRQYEPVRVRTSTGVKELPLVRLKDAPVRHEFEYRTIPWRNAKGEACFLTYLFNEDLLNEYRLEALFGVPVKQGVDLITNEEVEGGRIVMPVASVRLIEWAVADTVPQGK